jgi:hypothetical protein
MAKRKRKMDKQCSTNTRKLKIEQHETH